jgi:hypothetical protein
MLGRRTRTAGLAAVAAAMTLAVAGPAEATTDQRAARPQERAAIGPIAAAVVAVGTRIGVKYGPKIVKLIRGGSRAAKRGRAAARSVTRWGRRYAGRGRRLAIAAWAAFRRLPKWVQGCGLSAVKARLHGANTIGMAIACLRGILLVAGGKDPTTDPGAFMAKRRAGPAYA